MLNCVGFSGRVSFWNAPVWGSLSALVGQRQNPRCKKPYPPPNNGCAKFCWKRAKIKKETSVICSCSLANDVKLKKERARCAHVSLQMIKNQRGNERLAFMLTERRCDSFCGNRTSSHIFRPNHALQCLEIDHLWKLTSAYCLAGMHRGFWRCPTRAQGLLSNSFSGFMLKGKC